MRDDNELVLAARSGDEDAFAAIYDRYADGVYDFCSAVLRDPQRAATVVLNTFVLAALEMYRLRDGSKLEAWLFAVGRDQVLHSETSPPALSLETEGVAAADDGEREATAIVWQATSAFDERSRVLLDLEVRQRLDPATLAMALGVSRAHARVLVRRLLERSERLLRAALVARLGVAECPRVAALAQRADGHVTASWYRRVEHHVAACRTCSAARASVPDPLQLLAAVPVEPAPPELRDETLYRVYVLTAGDEVIPTRDDSEELADTPASDEPTADEVGGAEIEKGDEAGAAESATKGSNDQPSDESRDDGLQEQLEEFLGEAAGTSPQQSVDESAPKTAGEPNRDPAEAASGASPEPAGDPEGSFEESSEEPAEQPSDTLFDESAREPSYVDAFELAPPPVPFRRNGFPPSMYPERRRRTRRAAVVAAALIVAAVVVDFRGFGGVPERLLAAGAQAPRTSAPVQTAVTTAATAPPTTTAPDRVAPFIFNLGYQFACVGPRNPKTEVIATVKDDRKVANVVLVATDSQTGTAVSKPMTQFGDQYRAVLGPYEGEGSVDWRVIASDPTGNISAASGPRFATSAIC